MRKSFPAEGTYQQAKRFLSSFEILTAYIEERFHTEKHVINMSVPALVNLAFSCELFFKCIIHFENERQEGGHNLSSLFHKLPTTTKTFIYDVLYGSSIFHKENFDSDITSVADAFAGWRYLNEGISAGSINTKFLRALVFSSCFYVEEKFPEWKTRYASNAN